MHSDFNIKDFIERLDQKNKPEKFLMFICGILIYAIAFSIFYSPRSIITGGFVGISLIVYDVFKIDTSITVFVSSFVTLLIGYFLLGKDVIVKTVFGVILFPVFMEFGKLYGSLIDFGESSMFLVVCFGGVFMGFGNGLVIRSGYSAGGFQTIYQILYKYFGISIAKSTLVLNGILIMISGYFFGITSALYAIVGLYISSYITDRVMLETSATKTFYIVTDKEKEISQYIVENMGYGVTLINAKGGYSNEDKKVLMCAVPTREYYQMKEMVQVVDKDVFFLITDTYEIYDGSF